MTSTKTYRMKIRVCRRDHETEHVTEDVRATNAWDAEAVAVARVKKSYDDAYAVYAVTKRRIKEAS